MNGPSYIIQYLQAYKTFPFHFSTFKRMIRNVYGNEVTKDTVIAFLGSEHNRMCSDNIGEQAKAEVALDLKNTQGKEDEEGMRYIEKLRDRWSKDESTSAFTHGWIYNASGETIILVSCRNWGGSLVSSPYPLRIGNGQWGMFLQKQDRSDLGGCSGAVVYKSVRQHRTNFYWCIAWSAEKYEDAPTQTNVHVKIDGENDWNEIDTWESISEALRKTCSLHRADYLEQEIDKWYSVITATSGPHAIFEAVIGREPL